jgi:hypothetical protein
MFTGRSRARDCRPPEYESYVTVEKFAIGRIGGESRTLEDESRREIPCPARIGAPVAPFIFRPLNIATECLRASPGSLIVHGCAHGVVVGNCQTSLEMSPLLPR